MEQCLINGNINIAAVIYVSVWVYMNDTLPCLRYKVNHNYLHNGFIAVLWSIVNHMNHFVTAWQTKVLPHHKTSKSNKISNWPFPYQSQNSTQVLRISQLTEKQSQWHQLRNWLIDTMEKHQCPKCNDLEKHRCIRHELVKDHFPLGEILIKWECSHPIAVCSVTEGIMTLIDPG